MPRPNTRFLRHIIKDTNTHNAALLKKETAESRARLEELDREKERSKRRLASPEDVRRRQLGDIHAILGGGSSKRGSAHSMARRKADEKSLATATPKSAERHHRTSATTEPSEKLLVPERHRSREDDLANDELFGKQNKRIGVLDRTREDGVENDLLSERKRRRHADDEGHDRQRRRHRNRSDSPKSRRRSQSPVSGAQNYRQRSPVNFFPSESKSRSQAPKELIGTKSTEHLFGEMEHDLDDFEDFGPQPEPQLQDKMGIRIKGRGATSGPSGIDRRFSETYDPKTDIQPDEDDTWEEALEAYRDRQKWKQNQEDRLKSAGWTDEDIKKWRTPEQDSEQTVRWAKAGERREWDRGKVFRRYGSVE